MSTTTHDPAATVGLQHDCASIGRAPRAAHAFAWAQAANHAHLDSPPRCAYVSDLDASSTYSVGYTPSAIARWLWLSWVQPPDPKGAGSGSDVSTLTLTIRDTSGGSWTAGVPSGFGGEDVYGHLSDGATRFSREIRQEGWVDLDTVRGALTGTDWTLELVTTVDSYISRFQAWECPRFVADDSVTGQGGAVPGTWAPHAPIISGETVGSPPGLERVLVTTEAARVMGRTYLSLTWPEAITEPIPQTAATSMAYMTNLEVDDDGATGAVSWTIRVRRLYAASTAGEAIRWRFRYRFDGGLGSESAIVRLSTGATGSPYDWDVDWTTTWTWSDWVDGEVPTDGTGTVATLSLEAEVSSAATTLYLAGLQVEEAAT